MPAAHGLDTPRLSPFPVDRARASVAAQQRTRAPPHGNAPGPLLRGAVRDAELHARGGEVQRHPALADPRDQAARGGAGRAAVQSRAQPDASDRARPADGAASARGAGSGPLGAGAGHQLLRAAHRPAEAGRRARRLVPAARRHAAPIRQQPIPTPRSRCTTTGRSSCARRCAGAISRWCVLPQRTHELDDLHYYPVGEDRLFAIMPEGHALAALRAVPLGDAGRPAAGLRRRLPVLGGRRALVPRGGLRR